MGQESKATAHPGGFFSNSSYGKQSLAPLRILASCLWVAIGGLSLFLGACATVFDGPRPTLAISSEPSEAAVIDEKSNTELGTTPVELHRRPAPLRVRLEHSPNCAESLQLRPVFNRTAIWNLINPIGWLIDLASGNIREFKPRNRHYTLNCTESPSPPPPPPPPSAPSPKEPEDIVDPIPSPPVIEVETMDTGFSVAEESDIYFALADLADRLNCPKAISYSWRALAEDAAARGAGQSRHFAKDEFAQAISAALEENRAALERACQQPSALINQCSELLSEPPIVTLGASEPPDWILFDFDKAVLKYDDERRLVELAKSLNMMHGLYGVLLIGFADPIGTDKYNLKLGCRRALAVEAALAAAELPRELIVVRTLGENRTYQLNPGKGGSSDGAELNRRVTIQIIPYGSGVDQEDDCIP